MRSLVSACEGEGTVCRHDIGKASLMVVVSLQKQFLILQILRFSEKKCRFITSIVLFFVCTSIACHKKKEINKVYTVKTKIRVQKLRNLAQK